MPTNYGKDIKRILKDAGCHFVRHGRGDHEVWFSPITGKGVIVDSGCKSRHTANETLKQAGLPKAF
jgi:hypothetical protein